MIDRETVGFNKLQQTLIEKKDTKSLDMLNAIGKYPDTDITRNEKIYLLLENYKQNIN